MNIKNIFLVIVSVMLLSPTLLFFANTNSDQNGNSENQEPLVFNKKRPFEMFDTYYKYNFAFRKMLSQQYIDLKSNLANVSSLPDKVINGKEGWYFLGNSYNNVYSESLGIQKHTEKEINTTADKIIEMKRFCDSLGIKFYFFPAPNSHTIYKEYLPVKPNTVPREFDLIKAKVQEKVNFIDVRNALIAGKSQHILYYKTDTHWNRLGAYIGVQEVLKTIKKDFPKTELLSMNNYNVTDTIMTQMDLTKMLGIRVNDKYYDLEEKTKSNVIIKNDTIDKVPNTLMKNNTKPYKGIMYRDSFGVSMVPLLDQTFGSMNYFWTSTFNKQRILAEKPDFVIYEVVERNLNLVDIK